MWRSSMKNKLTKNIRSIPQALCQMQQFFPKHSQSVFFVCLFVCLFFVHSKIGKPIFFFFFFFFFQILRLLEVKRSFQQSLKRSILIQYPSKLKKYKILDKIFLDFFISLHRKYSGTRFLSPENEYKCSLTICTTT